YERGMVTLTRSGGVLARVHVDENRISPVFTFDSMADAHEFTEHIGSDVEKIRAEAESTTRHGKLLRLEGSPVGRQVIVAFCYSTGDAQGMTMIVRATDRACRWILDHSRARRFQIFSGLSLEKRAGGMLFSAGKGKKVTAGATIPAATRKKDLHATPARFLEVWHHTTIGPVHGGALGFYAHHAHSPRGAVVARRRKGGDTVTP